MLAVQVRSGSKRDKELAAIGPRAAIRHRHDTRACVKKRVVELIFEFAAPDRFAAATGASGIAALKHEAGDDAVEDDAIVLASVGKACKVLTRL